MFSWLEEQGANIALASSTRREHVYPMLDGADLTKYFKAIVCGDMVGHSKPDPEIFLAAAAKLGADPADCYIIEDSYNGIRAAHAAGAHPIMVPDIVRPDDEIKGLTEAVLPTLLNVRDYLEEHCEA
ncbi:MAG: HAD family hydrolase [Ruminococcus sp.]|nr:HAD family hydrolase [Ruminococcus sp.]